jgi:hypothetical protein
MTLHLAKPSIPRVIWSMIAVAVVACVVTGIALSVGFINGHNDNGAVPNGEYLRLVITCLTIWGPMYLMIAWQISIPTIIALGALAACVRRRPVSTDQGSQRPAVADPDDRL